MSSQPPTADDVAGTSVSCVFLISFQIMNNGIFSQRDSVFRHYARQPAESSPVDVDLSSCKRLIVLIA